MNLFVLFAGILVPPLGVGLLVGFTKHFWINLILTLFGYLPGIVHFVWLFFSQKPKTHLKVSK